MEKKRTTVVVPEALWRLYDRPDYGEAGPVQDALRAYAVLMSRAKKEALPLFSGDEWHLLMDALNATHLDPSTAHLLPMEIEDACRLDGLDDKWGVDKNILTNKLTPYGWQNWAIYLVAQDRQGEQGHGDQG